jgi:hypothetical protein
MSQQQVLEGIGVLSYLLPFSAGVWARKSLSEPVFGVVCALVAVNLAAGIASLADAGQGMALRGLQAAAAILVFGLITVYYGLLYPFRNVRGSLVLLAAVFATVLSFIWWQFSIPVDRVSRISFASLSLTSLPAVYFLYRLLTHPEKRELWYSHVVIHVALLVFTLGNAINLALALYFDQYLTPLLINLEFAVTGIHILLVIIVNLLYSFAFICQNHK